MVAKRVIAFPIVSLFFGFVGGYVSSLVDFKEIVNSVIKKDTSNSLTVKSDSVKDSSVSVPIGLRNIGGLSRNGRCGMNFVDLGTGFCQQVVCQPKVIQYNGRVSQSGMFVDWDYYNTGLLDDPRLVKLDFKCEPGKALVLGRNIKEKISID